MPSPSPPTDPVQPGAVALLGVPWDEHSSYLRGAAEAPGRIRAVLHAGASNLCAESGHDIGADPLFRDLGDLALGTTGDNLDRIESGIAGLLDHGARVISLGGDHAITYPILRAHAAHHDDLTVLQLDAHPDLYEDYEGDRLSHASPFARILEEGAIRRLVQVGIRTMNAEQRRRAKHYGVEVIEMREFAARGVPALEQPLYLSIDLDALDPAYAPGVAHHEPGGMTTRQVIDLIQQLPVAPVGADIVELIPRRDLHDMTAAVAAKLVKEIAARILDGSG